MIIHWQWRKLGSCGSTMIRSIQLIGACVLTLSTPGGLAAVEPPAGPDSGTQVGDVHSIADSEPGGAIYSPFAVSSDESAAKAERASHRPAQKNGAEDVPGLAPTVVTALAAAGIFLFLLRLVLTS
jgi:hypothetical protein